MMTLMPNYVSHTSMELFMPSISIPLLTSKYSCLGVSPKGFFAMHWILLHTDEDLDIEIKYYETHMEDFYYQSLKMKELNLFILSLVFYHFG